MENLFAIIVAIILILIIVGSVTLDIINCQYGYGIAGKTTLKEYLLGGNCRALVFGSTVNSQINGTLVP